MKKCTSLIVLGVFAFISAHTQPCLPEGIVFSTQEQIDHFMDNYPGCNSIKGDVGIQGDDITNLEGLNVLTSIEGTLCIKKNGSLINLHGLAKLTYVKNLMIINNDALTNLSGLESLKNINGYLHIWYNDSLINLVGLDNISYIGSDLMIEGNYSLLSCRGLEHLAFIGGNMVMGCIAGWMHYNRSLKSLAGLDKLSQIIGLLWINCNDSLTDLSGLESLVTIGDGLIVNGNKSLINLKGLENLKSCGGRLIIGGWWEDCAGNPLLTSLEGIENIEQGSISELRIRNNPLLANCTIKCICNYLACQNATVVIEENRPGCNSIIEVKEACESIGIEEANSVIDVLVYPNPSKSGNITFTLVDTDQHGMLEFKCFNIFGQEIHKKKLNKLHGGYKIENQHLKPGVYLGVMYLEGKAVGQSRFIVE